MEVQPTSIDPDRVDDPPQVPLTPPPTPPTAIKASFNVIGITDSYSPSTEDTSDIDCDSDDDDDDDEYTPTQDAVQEGSSDDEPEPPKRAGRARTTNSTSKQTVAPRYRTAPASVKSSKRKSPRKVTSRIKSTKNAFLETKAPKNSGGRRNVPSKMSLAQLSKLSQDNGNTCAEPACPKAGHKFSGYKEFQRHIETHYPVERDMRNASVCLGVPYEERHLWEITEEDKVNEWQGRLWIGGCNFSFSRRDAFLRHIRNDNCNCLVPGMDRRRRL
jgi:hypothetical protein